MAAKAVLVPLSRSGGYGANSNFRGLESLQNAIQQYRDNDRQNLLDQGKLLEARTPLAEQRDTQRVLQETPKNMINEEIMKAHQAEYGSLYKDTQAPDGSLQVLPRTGATPAEQADLDKRRAIFESGTWGGTAVGTNDQRFDVLDRPDEIVDPKAYGQRVYNQLIQSGVSPESAQKAQEDVLKRNPLKTMTEAEKYAEVRKNAVLDNRFKASNDAVLKLGKTTTQASTGTTSGTSGRSGSKNFAGKRDQMNQSIKERFNDGILSAGNQKSVIKMASTGLNKGVEISTGEIFYPSTDEVLSALEVASIGENGAILNIDSRVGSEKYLRALAEIGESRAAKGLPLTGKTATGSGGKGASGSFTGYANPQAVATELQRLDANYANASQFDPTKYSNPSSKEIVDSVFNTADARQDASKVLKSLTPKAASPVLTNTGSTGSSKTTTKKTVLPATEAELNKMPEKELRKYLEKSGTKLEVHPANTVFGVDISKEDVSKANAKFAKQRQKVLDSIKTTAEQRDLSRVEKEIETKKKAFEADNSNIEKYDAWQESAKKLNMAERKARKSQFNKDRDENSKRAYKFYQEMIDKVYPRGAVLRRAEEKKNLPLK